MSIKTSLVSYSDASTRLVREYTNERIGKGTQTIKLPWTDIDPGSITVVERPGAYGSLTMTEATVKPAGRGAGTEIQVRSRRNVASFKVIAKPEVHEPPKAGEIQKKLSLRLDVKRDGSVGELEAKILYTNPTKMAIAVDTAEHREGKTNNGGGGYRPMARMAYEAVPGGGGDGGGVGANIHSFRLPNEVRLPAHASKLINLFGRDFQPKKVDTVLTFAGQGAFLGGKNGRVREDSPVDIAYEIANTKENGLGLILPGGSIEVMVEGIPVSQTNAGKTLIGATLSIAGGPLLELTSTRRQTAFEAGPRGARNEVRPVAVEEEITFCNAGEKGRAVQFTDQIQESQADDGAKISKVSVNGQELADDAWSYDEESNVLKIPGLEVPGREGEKAGETKVSYRLETTAY